MKVCKVDLRLHLRGALRSACGYGWIVRLKPELLRAFVAVRGAGWCGMGRTNPTQFRWLELRNMELE